MTGAEKTVGGVAGRAPWKVSFARPLLSGESLDGYVARVAAAEFMPRTLDISSMAGAMFAHRPNVSRCDRRGLEIVADCLRVDVEVLLERGFPLAEDPRRASFFGTMINRRHFQVSSRAYAPSALALSCHHRALWTLRPFPFSDETWEVLTDRCPSDDCAAIQRWHHTNGIDLCDRCGAALTDAKPTTVPKHLRQALFDAIGLVHPDEHRRAASLAALPIDVANLSHGEALDLLCAVATVVNPAIREPRAHHLISRTAEPEAVVAAIAEAWSLLLDWPHGFERLAGARLSQRRGRHGDGNGGATIRFLLGPGDRFTAAVARCIDDLVCKLRTNTASGYDAKAAAVLTGAKLTALVEARRSGELPTIFHLVGTRSVPLLERAAVEHLRNTERLPITWAAARLGISHSAIADLVARGRLDAAKSMPGRTSQPHVTLASVQSLMIKLSAASQAKREDAIPIRRAMSAISSARKPWAQTIAAMLDGSLRYHLARGIGHIMGRVTIAKADIPLLLSLVPNSLDAEPLMLTKLEATEVLNIGVSKARDVIGAWESTCGPEATVPLDAVLRIAKRYIAAAEISVRLNIEARAVIHLMRARGIRKQSEAGFLRSEVANEFPELR